MSSLPNLNALESEWAVFMENKAGNRNSWTQDQRWRADNPGEQEKLLAYREGGVRPVLSTVTGRRMVFHVDAYLLAKDQTPPPSEFGKDIPAPPVTAPVGPRLDVSTLSELRNALAGSATWIRITQTITVGGDLNITRKATAASPLWVEGGRLDDCRVLIQGASYLRLEGIEIVGGYDGIKIEGDSHHVVLNRLNVRDIKLIGLLVPVTGNASDLHVLNTRFVRCGYDYAAHGLASNQTHSIYIGRLTRGVFQSLYSEAPQAYSYQFYPGPTSDILMTACTSKGGITRGGMVVQGVTGLTVVGYVCEDAPADAVLVYSGSGTVYDSIRWNSGGFGSGLTYTNCVEADPATAAKNHVQPSRYGLLPATDIEGRPRVTADAGCFAYA